MPLSVESWLSISGLIFTVTGVFATFSATTCAIAPSSIIGVILTLTPSPSWTSFCALIVSKLTSLSSGAKAALLDNLRLNNSACSSDKVALEPSKGLSEASW